MSQSDSPVAPHTQLAAFCRAHPRAPKVIVVPRAQIGRALEDALAQELDGWAGVTTRIVRHYAEQVAQPRVLASGRRELPVGGRSFLAARLLNDLEERGQLDGLPGPQQLADTVARALETLRRTGAALGDVQSRAESDEASATFRVVAECYEGYLNALDAHNLYDDAQVFRWATEIVQEETPPAVASSVVAVCDAVELPERPYHFLHAVRSVAGAFYRIRHSHSETPPPQTAAARFGDVAPPATAENRDGTTTEVNVRRAVGSAKEVDAVLRDVLDSGRPLDEVEIAVAGEQPYVSLIADRAGQLDLPVSIATGVPAEQTRTGKALLSFLEWVTDDFDAAVLIRMLRSGHLRIDRERSKIEAAVGAVDLEAHEVATLLAERRYEPGREGYGKALEAAVGRVNDRIEELEAEGLYPERDRERRRALQFVHQLVDELLDLVPRTATVQEIARKALKFVEQFGPVERPPDDKPEAERTLDEAARTVLWERLKRLSQAPVDYEASGPRLASLLQRWLEGQYVRAEHPRPGTAHVVPLESAGYGNRSHLYIVGMDSDTLSTVAVENAMLRDPDRRALSESLDGAVATRGSAADEAQWHHDQALARHNGALSIYTRVFDLDSGEERYPSPLFLRLEETASVPSERVEAFVPPKDGIRLSDPEEWLSIVRDRRGDGDDSGGSARDTLHEEYPWIRRGEAAREARQSDEYTVHDGLLTRGTYPELDFLGGAAEGEPMSAGRLETFAETPYLYFLKYVLGVEPLDEPALDDEPWLNALRRGSILHTTFDGFMTTLENRGEQPGPEHEPLLKRTLQDALDVEVEKVAPPSEVVKEAAFRQLWEDALVFLRAETDHCRVHDPLYHEVGFGYGTYRKQKEDFGAVTLTIDGRRMSFRGRIDRVDRRPDGTMAVWDYKTGGASSFEEDDPVANGAQLQWALYAYALATLTQETVGMSGYYFPTTRERGARIAFDPERYREEVERVLERLSALAAAGSFPMNPRARYLNAWRYRGYDRIFHDLSDRSDSLKAKSYPEDHPTPPSFE